MSNQLRIIRIKFDTQNDKVIKDIQSSVKGLHQELSKTNSVLGGFNKIFSAVMGASFLGVGIAQVTQLADRYSLLSDRIKILSKDSSDGQKALDGIFKIARDNNSSVEAVGTSFTRLSAATKELGLGTAEILKVTDLLTKTFRLSGATAEEATSATIQLSQGLATGALRGQELRSVTEANVYMGELLAKQLKSERGELIKLGEAGKITNQVVFKALLAGEQDLNEKSANLTITFGQLADKIGNELTKQIGKLSKDLGVAGTLSKGVDYLIEKLPALAAALTAVLVPLGLIAGSKLVRFLYLALTNTNPLVRVLTVLASVVFLVADNFDVVSLTIAKSIERIKIGIGSLKIAFIDLIEGVSGKRFNMFSNMRDSALESVATAKQALADLQNTAKKGEFVGPPKPANFDNLGKGKEEAKKLKDILAELNKEYNTGKITLDQYLGRLSNFEMEKLQRSLKEGKINLEQFNEKLRDLHMEDMRRLFERGVISVNTFNEAIKQNKIQDLNQKFKEGRITLEEYHRTLIGLTNELRGDSALYAGTSDFLQRIGTVSQNVAGLIADTFGRLEDSLVSFLETGKFSFKEFANEVIKEINRIIIRALIIRPLAQGILNFAGASNSSLPSGTTMDYSSAGGNTAMAAKGFAPNGTGVKMFANGGIVNGATPFSYGRGRRGVMGEAGPEAILPLTRDASGSLGVNTNGMGSNVTVNIVNQSGSEITQTETQNPDGSRQLDILITTKVKEGIANGAYDRTFQSIYGLNRKGM